MKPEIRTWLGQVTTGHGIMVLVPTALAIMSGTMSWQAGLPLLMAGIVGLAWPENAPLETAVQSFATDVAAAIAAYRAGSPSSTGSVPEVIAPEPASARIGAGASGLTLLFATSFALAACADQTADQRAQDVRAIAAGLVCIADAAGKVVATASTTDPDMVKAANAAVAAGGVLTTDTACQAAVTSGVAAATPSAAH